MTKIRWGILATGWIADQLAQAITDTTDGEIVAVASRTQAKADTFGDKWQIPNRYATYEALAADPAVEVIYIATPHSHHYDNMLLCLNAGKHVLCEKAFTLDAKQAQECIALAREKGVFLMEAMWTRYNPAVTQAKRWVDEGLIGEVRLIKADFCINVPFDAAHRLYNPDLGGGALLDLGIYPLSLSTFFLGLPDSYTTTAHLNAQTGVDELAAITLNYKNGAVAQLTTSQRVALPVDAYISGSQGSIQIHEQFFKAEKLTLSKVGSNPEVFDMPLRSNGYIYQVEEVHACLRAGKLESERMPLAESLALMRLMDTMRASWGFQYPHEKAGRMSSTPR